MLPLRIANLREAALRKSRPPPSAWLQCQSLRRPDWNFRTQGGLIPIYSKPILWCEDKSLRLATMKCILPKKRVMQANEGGLSRGNRASWTDRRSDREGVDHALGPCSAGTATH